jgi:hypothetical protein
VTDLWVFVNRLPTAGREFLRVSNKHEKDMRPITIAIIAAAMTTTAAQAVETRGEDEVRAWRQECLGDGARAVEAEQVAGGQLDHYCEMLSRMWGAGQDPEVLARILLDMRREADAKKEQDNPPADTATAAPSPIEPEAPPVESAAPPPPSRPGFAFVPPFLQHFQPFFGRGVEYTRDPRLRHCTMQRPCWRMPDGRITQ